MHKPRLSLVKRTKQLSDSQPVVLKTDGTEAGTVWAEKGDVEMQPSDNEELTNNLLKARIRAAVEKMVDAVLAQAAQFFEVTVSSMMPDLLLNDQAKLDWMTRHNIECHQNGLLSVVKMGGKVLAEAEAEIPVAWKALVELRLKQIQAQEAQS